MTLPTNIYWRESFGYGWADLSQVYLMTSRPTNNPYYTFLAAENSAFSLVQWGRGTGADQGWAISGNDDKLVVRMSTLGLPSQSNGVALAFAYNQNGNVGGSILAEFIDDDGLGDGSFSVGLLHLTIGTLADGRIAAFQGMGNGGVNGPIIGSPSTYVLPVGGNSQNAPKTWIEIKNVNISSTTGSVQVYAEGALVLNLSNVNTRNPLGGSGKIGYIGMGCNGGRLMTDLVITDGSQLLGDSRVSYFHANVLGTLTAGTATGAGTILGCVQEQAMDGDSTYIDFDNTSLPKGASFTTNALPANAVTVIEVTPQAMRRKTDSGVCTDRLYFKSGATVDDGGTDLATPTGYTRTSGVLPARAYRNDPNTSAAWTLANCNAVEIGSKRTA